MKLRRYHLFLFASPLNRMSMIWLHFLFFFFYHFILLCILFILSFFSLLERERKKLTMRADNWSLGTRLHSTPLFLFIRYHEIERGGRICERVCVSERKKDRKCVCVCVCMRERERERRGKWSKLLRENEKFKKFYYNRFGSSGKIHVKIFVSKLRPHPRRLLTNMSWV